MVLADVYARYHRIKNPHSSVVFSIGTDEHGLKIQRAAEAEGLSPKELCDGVSLKFRHLADAAGISYSRFIRTSDADHVTTAQDMWAQLSSRGLLYKAKYAGWYAVSDEAYYPEAQLATDASGARISAETGSRVEWTEEENYMFCLGQFREPLLKWLGTEPVQPPSRGAQLLREITQPEAADFADLSISRPASRLAWGIPVPGDPEHTMYVWVEALINYLTVAKNPTGADLSATNSSIPPPSSSSDGSPNASSFSDASVATQPGDIWPPNLMILGKDIVRFHALYLPAILVALDLPLPKHLLVHGHWTMDKFKMSKSRGNVADPFALMETYGTDTVRAFLMSVGGNPAADADYSEQELKRFQKHLASKLGNLYSRTYGPKLRSKLHISRMHTRPADIPASFDQLIALLETLPSQFDTHVTNYNLNLAFSTLNSTLFEANRLFQESQPWADATSPATLHACVYYTSEALRIVGILLQPFMPSKAAELLHHLGIPQENRSFAYTTLHSTPERLLHEIYPNPETPAARLF